ncbi:TaqI-like C-terminal specificity domain-containing protein [Desulfococcaceae bacterium HSG7]|nr:TaqI-like C-terminal specificity domain-containing protein [Desulfococcaceae bacterium HSG7]
MNAPDKIKKLTETFDYNLETYKKGSYNETQVRREFIDPFFEALGWDIANKKGYAEAYKDVIHEDAIKIGGATKAPDYCFRIGGARKFFLEAKKPAVNIKTDIHPAFQLRRYGWSAKLPLSILTDFEEFAVYDCRVRPVKTDMASHSRIFYLKYTDYIDRWEEIESIFSRVAILKGSFDKYAASKKNKRGTALVDTAFLQEIERWRELLARNIALRNKTLSQRALNFAIQQTVDRIIFLRICEDRGIESYGRLMALRNGVDVYKRLFELFRKADDKYNSGLFHFKEEKNRKNFDPITPALFIDDKVLKDIFKNLYYPDSPYEFSVLPADILGQVYEKFLGKVIRLTPKHQAKIEEKPEVRKAGGVYYTPTYIVDYIVKQTVGKLIKGKKAGPGGAVSRLKILDPACGSGSFLIGAYQFLLDWHLDQYVNDNPEKLTKGKKPRLYQTDKGEWRLTADERKRILLNNIYGVDIDPQAVEVTKLSLLLKVLEGENKQSIGQLALFQERVLPDLSNNIKCGNSLIGPDFYEKQQMNIFDEEEIYRVNAFDWDAEFADIMGKGGFDAVIGNPPYVRHEMLGDAKPYLQNHYSVYQGTADLYVYFIQKSISLLHSGGLFSFIVANKWLRANYGKPLREWLKLRHIVEIADFGDLPVFQQATTYPCILVIKKSSSSSKTFKASKVKHLNFPNLWDYINQISYEVNQTSLDVSGWSLVDKKTQKLIDKLFKTGVPLSEYVEKKVYYGIKTGLNKAFVIDVPIRDKLIAEDPKSEELIKPFLLGKEIKKYQPPLFNHYLIFIPKWWTNKQIKGREDAWKWLKNNYPAITSYLEPFSKKAQKRYDKGEYWWELRACKYYDEFEKPKIIYPNICKRPEFTFDANGLYTNQKCFIISVDDKYLLGILNSSVTFFLFASILPKLRGDFYEPSYVYFKKFPIRTINLSKPSEKKLHAQMINLVDQMLNLNKKINNAKLPQEKNMLQRQIQATDKQIDQLVYKLYDLTDEEIKIVESET